MDAKVLVIGEAPGEEEDSTGKQFTGRSGQLLRQVLTEIGVNAETEVAYTNVVRCRPPNNKLDKQAITYCKQFAIGDINRSDASVILLMGNSPLSGILGKTGISEYNGSVIKKDDKLFVPLYHPAYILRDMSKLDEWLSAIDKALHSDGKEKVDSFTRIYPKTIDEVKAMYKYLKQFEYISMDTETSSLDAFSDHSLLLSISFAAGNQSYAVVMDHPESQWSAEGYPIVVNYIRRILTEHNNKVIGHNIKFDLMHVFAQLGIWFEIGGDSMLVSHLLDSKQGIHGLKHLAGIHLDMYGYEDDLTDYIRFHHEANAAKGGSYANIPLDVLLPYGAMDAEATLMLHHKLYAKLSTKQQTLYNQLIIPASTTLCRMQCNGLKVDDFVAKRYAILYKMSQDRAFAEILADKKVRKMIREKTAEINAASKSAKKREFVFNPNSSYQLSELYFKHYKIPILQKTNKGAPSTSGSAYKKLEDKYKILKLIRYYKLMTKMLSTYLIPASTGVWSSSDGLVHTTYNQHGTRTGRLSSSQPVNLQNIPTAMKEPGTLLETLPIKNVFTTQFEDGWLVALDYSGMELRVFASCADCQPMLDIHKSGKDFHTMVASMISKLPYEEITKPQRYIYKWTNWTLLYGGDAHTLHSMYDIPMEEAEQAVAQYYDRFPEVLDYRQSTQEFAESHGYIESPFGRREQLPNIDSRLEIGLRNKDRRIAVNMPIQSAASDTLLCALVIIDREMQRLKLRSKLVNTVHDSIVIDCPRDEVEIVATLCKDIMEHIKGYAAKHLPGVDFSWLKSPLKADVEVGKYYGTEIDFEEWSKEHGS